ncbi:hypothetical protein Btru_055988 [Bulinus truncatus]|nr:hypothetical protein Btru_055988 [Bulinus truncatus]
MLNSSCTHESETVPGDDTEKPQLTVKRFLVHRSKSSRSSRELYERFPGLILTMVIRHKEPKKSLARDGPNLLTPPKTTPE